MKGSIASLPVCPETMPTSIAPSSSSCAPSVNDSLRMCPVPVAQASAPDAQRRRLVRTTARMMAGDSISAIAAAMCPPKGTPEFSRCWVAVMKVTALTEP